jgi:hypothetical protein
MGVGGMDDDRKTDFRQAMALPAGLPEFQGNVVAVQTGEFWSEELELIAKKRDQIRGMSSKIRKKHKSGPNADGKMTKEAQRSYLAAFEKKLISPKEAALWKRGAPRHSH